MLNKFIKKENIIFLETGEVKESINSLIEKAYDLGKIKNKENFKEAILEREKLVSTGIGLGVAIPHAKLEEIEDFFIIVGINKEGIDWDAIDRKPVSAVFLIGGPNGEQNSYLKIISKLILLIKNESRREVLFNAAKAEEVEEIFSSF